MDAGQCRCLTDMKTREKYEIYESQQRDVRKYKPAE